VSALSRRLIVLEDIAEQARVCELRWQLEDDARAADMRPDLIAGHVSRLLAIERQVQAWLAAGVSRDDISRRCAVEIGVDPETFAQEVAAAWKRETGCIA
jgi:hypothetical protein